MDNVTEKLSDIESAILQSKSIKTSEWLDVSATIAPGEYGYTQISYEEINDLLGKEIAPDHILNIFIKLSSGGGCVVTGMESTGLTVVGFDLPKETDFQIKIVYLEEN